MKVSRYAHSVGFKNTFIFPELPWMTVSDVYVLPDTQNRAIKKKDSSISLWFYGGSENELIKVGDVKPYGFIKSAPFLFAKYGQWKDGARIDRSVSRGLKAPTKEALIVAWNTLEKVSIAGINNIVAMKVNVGATGGDALYRIYMLGQGLVGRIDNSGKLFVTKPGGIWQREVGDEFTGKEGVEKAIRLINAYRTTTPESTLTELTITVRSIVTDIFNKSYL